MSTLQFSLFFAAILIGYLLIHLRLVRFESYLQEIAGLKTLNDRLESLSSSVERVRVDRVEEQISRLHDDLVSLLEQLARFERTVHQDLVEVGTSAPAPAPQSAAAEPAGLQTVRALIEARLLAIGYGDLRIITDLADVHPDARLDVRVEATRQQMPFKGTVTIHNGAVTDVALQSAAQSFP